MFTTLVFAICVLLSWVAAQMFIPQPYNAQSFDSDPKMRTINSGQETGTFFSHPGFSSKPRQPYVAGTKKRFIIALPTYCRALLSLDMTNTSNFNIRDYDFGVMFDGKLAQNLGTSMCDLSNYVKLQQKGINYQSVTTSDMSASRIYLSSTNVAVFDFCVDPYNRDIDMTRRLGFSINWSCIRTPATPTTAQTTTTTPVNTVDCGIPMGSGNGPASVFQRIVGGVPVAPLSWPWAVALVTGGQHFCGASVLNNQWVVTAAQCIDPSTETQFKQFVQVYYGNQNLSKIPDSQKVTVARAIMHPNYNINNLNNDVALIKLTAPIPNFPNPMVSPICLPSQPIGTFKAQSSSTKGRPYAYVAGWGTLHEGQYGGDATIGLGSDQLQQISIEVFNNSECQAAYPSWRLPDTSICGGLDQGGRDACQGDSGGPLVMAEPPSYNRYSLYGIVSSGRGCANPGTPGLYSDVFKVKKWIMDTMAAN
ncbi:transmembrane protease serine 9-like [Paramacrobiotus metropolitanus]|uniref:transmembrane protease serine 9-like n=1 Tax=Paramacrobiotus metropolitanus TaxID=2943436 RepID=UPI00244642F2|nr:transmembrane protease serine 9-like [Paramacrobiotus metropolitanus]